MIEQFEEFKEDKDEIEKFNSFLQKKFHGKTLGDYFLETSWQIYRLEKRIDDLEASKYD